MNRRIQIETTQITIPSHIELDANPRLAALLLNNVQTKKVFIMSGPTAIDAHGIAITSRSVRTGVSLSPTQIYNQETLELVLTEVLEFLSCDNVYLYQFSFGKSLLPNQYELIIHCHQEGPVDPLDNFI